MKTVAIGGNSRNIGKTSLAVALIEATPDLEWTAVKLTQFGHGICTRSGAPCACAVEDPLCPYDIVREAGLDPLTDTARMLRAGAAEVLWVRVAEGQLPMALPAIRQRLEGCPNVLFESNSIVELWPPDLFLTVLQFDVDDCKPSACRLADRADAVVLPRSVRSLPEWSGFDASILARKPLFAVQPPAYSSPEIVRFARERLACKVRPEPGCGGAP